MINRYTLKDFQIKFCTDVLANNYSHELLEIITPGGKLDTKDALGVYSQDYEFRLKEALGKNYEATWLLMGDDEFFSTCLSYIKKYPSEETNLTSYGGNFVSFLREEQLPREVVEMATFEKMYWERFHRADHVSIEITEEILRTKSFNLSNIGLISSIYDLEFLFIHREQGIEESASIQNNEGDFYFVLFRAMDKVEVKKLSKDAFDVLLELQECHFILKLKAREITPAIWSEVFKCLMYSSLN